MRALLTALTMTGAMILGCGVLEDAAEQWAEDMMVPPPAHLSEIVGAWQGSAVTLVVHADGLVEHEQSNGASKTSFSGPILEWSDDQFTAGIGPIRHVFHIDVPPARLEGVWTMTVNEDVLTRQE